MFGEVQTKPKERFAEVFEHHFENNLRYLKAEDVRMDGVDGLAFGVYWPVRDLSQCDKYGGFLEYMIVYFHKDDFRVSSKTDDLLGSRGQRGSRHEPRPGGPAKTVKVTEVE